MTKEIHSIEEFRAKYFPRMTEEDKAIVDYLHRHPGRRQDILDRIEDEKRRKEILNPKRILDQLK